MPKRLKNMGLEEKAVQEKERSSKGGCWKKHDHQEEAFLNFKDVLEWEADTLKHLEDAEHGLMYDGLTLLGWHGLQDTGAKSANAVARAEYKKVDKSFRNREPFLSDNPSAEDINTSSKLQVHKDGLGHIREGEMQR